MKFGGGGSRTEKEVRGGEVGTRCVGRGNMMRSLEMQWGRKEGVAAGAALVYLPQSVYVVHFNLFNINQDYEEVLRDEALKKIPNNLKPVSEKSTPPA